MQDLPTGLKFYQEAVGMERQSTLRLGGWDEHILNFPGAEGSSLVLVNWHDGKTREYKDVPVKLVFGLQDPVAFAKNLAVKGGTVIQEPAPRPEVGGATVGFGRDLMGYLLEMVKLSQLGGSTASNATKL
ncbi:hypothetical protein BZA05DRAFT_398839 [Tricharina praecox]|uniref:uncharacterized protein n=1 Tax=Tricharina praecox TaxID=43433 RepID=UPI00222106F4|nr:uncharacterized protein BZA05DRAFT_398839 [Tricharina praecox]KAI5850827.1 hypothetical protein BZA05DRAFT_398839 [Tricharina praecox]